MSFVFFILLLISDRKWNSLTRNHVLVQMTCCNNTATSTVKHNPHIRHVHICVWQHLAQHDWTCTVTVTLPSKLSSIIVKRESSRSCGWSLQREHSQCTHKGPQLRKEASKNPYLHVFTSLLFCIKHTWNFPTYCIHYICLFATIQMYGCLNIPFAKC